MPTLAADELKARLEAGEPLELVDIRETDEYDDWHIEGSRNLPVYEALKEDRTETLIEVSDGLPKGRSIVTVCRGGILSQKAAEVLISLGYDAISLDGGMRGWGRVWSTAPIPAEGMDVVQIRRNGKGCLSYVIGAGGEAAAIDPSVDAQAYIDTARERGMRITHVLETHVHADHISRAREICEITGAKLVMHPNQRVAYDYTPIRDGETIAIGGIEIEAIATPGHTSESTCYLAGGTILFSGDTLFVDSVGRPDLEKGDAGAEAGAHQLFGSLQDKLMKRFDDVAFYPCHHGGTIGFDRKPIGSSLRAVRSGLDLMQAGEGDFVKTILDSLRAKPGNHETIIAINEGKEDTGDTDPLELEAGPNCCAAG